MLIVIYNVIIINCFDNFRGYQQQDAHEFLIYLLNQLNVELSRGSDSSSIGVMGASKSTSIVKRLFGGLLQSDVSKYNYGLYMYMYVSERQRKGWS